MYIPVRLHFAFHKTRVSKNLHGSTRYRTARRIYTECISERAFHPFVLEAFIIKNRSLQANFVEKCVTRGSRILK